MDNYALWNLSREAWRAMFPSFTPIFDRFIAEKGLDERGLGWLFAAITFEPETITPARLQVRTPYTATEVSHDELVKLTLKGFLAETSPGEYILTPGSRAETLRLIEEGRAAMAEADPLPMADSHRLASLLGRLALTALNTPPPPDTWSIDLSYRLMPPASPPLPFFEQAMSCMGAYRDDAHLAAWQPSGLSAAALESLTLLWRSEADSLDALCEKLSRRGHSRRVYAEALEELRRQGFLEGSDSAPRLTEAGKSFREQMEQDTDRYFFAPWTCFNDDERKALADLFIRLRDGLKVKAS